MNTIKLINKKAVLFTVFLTIVMAFAFHFLHSKHEKTHESEGVYKITKPLRQDVDILEEFVAQIRASQHIELRSLEKGYLQNIYVDEGQFVHKDQEMFQIMPLIIEAEFKKAKAEYDLAKIEYENTLMLKQKNIVSNNELALSKAKLDKAAAEMNLAQTHLNFTTIKAPFDGIMDRFHVRLGSLVSEGELLTTLSDNKIMWVYFNVSEADYLDYMNHKKENIEPIKLMLANGDIFNHEGKIDTIEAEFNNEIGNVAFRASFENPERLLRHGETGTVILTKKHKNALTIPQKATFEILDKKFVYVVDEENKIHSRQIEIGGEIPHLFIINSGLSDDDKILLEGIGKVHENQEIETEFQDEETVKKGLELEAS